MKDFDIKKFLTENQITAASQQIGEAETLAPGYHDKQGNIPDPYYIFVVKFDDGDVFIGSADKGMGGITAGEWWEKVTREAAKGRGVASLVDKIKKVTSTIGKEDGKEEPGIPAAIPKQVDRAEDQESALVKIQKWVNNARKSIGDERVINKDTDEIFAKKINKAIEKKKDARTYKGGKDFDAPKNEGERRWNKLKEFFNIK